MPLNVSSFKAEDARVTFRWKDDTITLHYDRSKYTTQYIQDHLDEPNEVMLADLGTKWDVLDDCAPEKDWIDGEPPMFPFTSERLKMLPQGFIATAMRALSEDQRPNLSWSSQSGIISSAEEEN